MILHKLSPEQRRIALWWVLAVAQFSFVTSTLLSRFAGEQFSFLVGLLAGISVAGNIAFLSQYKTLRRK
jgi:hypothetical protein